MSSSRPKLSVVLTIVEGGAVLSETIDSLLKQSDDHEIEVLLPYDSSVAAEAEAFANQDARLRLLPLGDVPTARPKSSAAGQHELFDRRRAHGLKSATADLVAILEDRGIPAADWVKKAIQVHEKSSAAAIGGPVLCDARSTLALALYFCDFSRYQPPIVPGPAAWVTDVNIVYKRSALFALQDLWAVRYHETTVHWELRRQGQILELAADLKVYQRRGQLQFLPTLAERLQWGRLFAYTRAREMALWKRPIYALLAIFLPFLLFLRHGRCQVQKRQMLGTYLRCSPLVFVLLVFWSAGEALAYLGAKP